MPEPEVLSFAPANQPPGVPMPLRIKLSIMMVLQYAAWGAWWTVLSKYLAATGFSGPQIGAIYGTTAIASIFSPIIFGQIADRWMPTQFLLAGLHLGGAALLYLSTRYAAFDPFYYTVLAWALLYIPTVSLTNSLSLHHLPDASRDFPGIRVFGTIGWIVAGLIVGLQLNESSTQPIMLACGLSAVLGLFCLLLPHTPPTGKAGDALPFIKAFALLKDGVFATFLLVSFIVSVVLAGYYAFTAIYLADVGIQKAAAVMTVGQFTEMLLLPFLPLLLRSIGMKWTLALGMAAWGVRYGIFAFSPPVALVVLGVALHGICYDFFFVAAYIHVDNQASRDIRASAQALFNLVTMGLGMWVGNIFFGRLVERSTSASGVNWMHVWGLPTIGVVVALAIFAATFKVRRKPAEPANLCKGCGYDLTGNVSGVCPECGSAITA